ncbi:hypothetical protein PFISCL1PPCAC_26887, partial [Pristionchus fissidentatus]
MRSSSSNLYSFSGLSSSSSYKNPVNSSPSSTSYSSFSSSASIPNRFSSTSITPGSPSPLVSSCFLLDSPRKLSSITDYACAPSTSYESRLTSRRSSSSDIRPSQPQQNQRSTRTNETDSLLELYGVRNRAASSSNDPAKRKSGSILEERKKGGPLGTLEEDGVRFRRGSREGIFDLPGRESVLLGGRASEGSRYGEKVGMTGGGMNGGGMGGMGGIGGMGGMTGEMNQIEYTNRLLDAHKRVDDLLRKRGLSAEDERKYLRAWEEIPVVREVRNDRYARRARSNSSDSGLSTDSDETKREPPTEDIEADEDWEVDEYDVAEAEFVFVETPNEKATLTARAFGRAHADCSRVIAAREEQEIARRILVQPQKSRVAVSASFAASEPLKTVVVEVEKVMKKRIHKEGVLKSLFIPSKKKEKVKATIAVPAPIVIKKDEQSCVFRAPSRVVKREEKAPSPVLKDKVVLRRSRPASAAQPTTAAPEQQRPFLRKVRLGSLDAAPEPAKAAGPRLLHPLDACKTLLASLRPRRDRVARSSAEISVQHCSFFQTAQTIIEKARKLPEKHVRINLRLTERAPNKEKAKIVLACARVAQVRLDIVRRPPLVRRRTIQLVDPPAQERRPIGRLERSMTVETPFQRQERVVKPLQIPQSFLQSMKPTEEEGEGKEDIKAAREKLRKVPFVDCLTGLDLPIYWLDNPSAAPRSNSVKRKESEKKERLVDRLMRKETVEEKEEPVDKSTAKLKRQNAFKKKKKRGEEGDSISVHSLGADSTTSSLNSECCLVRRATTRDSATAVDRPSIAQQEPPFISIPDVVVYRPPSPLILNDVDRALVSSFRASLTIPKPVARPRPITPTPLTSLALSEANHRMRDYKSPPPPPAFVRRRTPPRNSEYEEEEVEEVEEEEEEEEVEEEAEQINNPAFEFQNGDNLTEAEHAMIAAKRRHEEEEAAKVEEYMEKRRLEKEIEEEELRKLKERQELRKKEREEEALAFAAKKEEEEEKRKIEEEERRARYEAEKAKREEEKNKRQQAMSGMTGGKNFVIPEKKDKGDKFGNIVQAKQEMGMTKDQQIEAKRAFMLAITKGMMDASGLLPADLKEKIKSLHQRICKLEAEKYDLEKRHERQEYDLKELNERQRQMARNSALKKGLDPNDSNSRHP